MADQCKKCGADVLSGMKFCRFCGTATGSLSPQETPTEHMPPAPVVTQQQPTLATSPVYLPPQQPTPYAQSPIEPPRQKHRWPWVLGLVVGCILLACGALGAGIYLLARQAPGLEGVHIEETDRGLTITKEGKEILTIDRNGARASADVISREIPIASGGTFALSTDLGDIDISAWDRDVISIRAKRHRGSARNRRRLDIEVDTSTPNTVIVQTKRPPESEAHLDYEIRVPRQVNIEPMVTGRGHVAIDGVIGNIVAETRSDDIRIKNVRGDVKVTTRSGDIELDDIVGNVSTQSNSGNATARLRQGSDVGDMMLRSNSGNISLRFEDEFDADLSINTNSGSIDVRGGIQLFVDRNSSGKTAQGTVGRGGRQSIRIQTNTGDIQLSH